MKRYAIIVVAAALGAACQQGPETGYVRLSLPDTKGLRAADAPTATFADAAVSEWTVSVSGEDIATPIVVETSKTEITLQVPAGAKRLVHVSGRGEAAAGLQQGYEGETTVDVPEGEEAEAVVDVYRSVSIIDANAPVNRAGAAAAASAPDVTAVTFTLTPTALQIFVTFSNDVAAPWNASQDGSVRGVLEFDTDRNPQTGKPSLVYTRHNVLRIAAGAAETDLPLGVDFAVDLAATETGFVRLLMGDVAKPVAAEFGAKRLSVTIPYEEIGGKPAAFRFTGLLADRDGSSDFVPEKDYVEVALTDTPAPTPELTAVTKFAGTFLKSVQRTQGASLPSIKAGPGGLVAAWTTQSGFEVATSELGQVFATNSVDMKGEVAVAAEVAIDEKTGASYLAVTKLDNPDCGNFGCNWNSVLYRNTEAGPSELYQTVRVFEYNIPYPNAKVVATGGIVHLLEPSSYSALPYFDLFKNDAYVDAVQPFSAQQSYYDLFLVGAEPHIAQNEMIYNGPPNYDYTEKIVTQKAAAGTVSLSSGLTVLNSTSLSPTNYYGVEGASNGTASYLVAQFYGTVDYDLAIFNQAGKRYTIANAYASDQAGYWSGGSYAVNSRYAQIAVSKSGRVGVVWHVNSAGFFCPCAPGGVAASPRLAPGDAGDEIYYAELLPGAADFSAPLLVGRGAAADITFDSTERPVVLVVDANLDQNGFPAGTQYLTVYRGQ